MKLTKWRHFHHDIILLNVRWYLAYPLSYRNLEEMMADRGIEIDHKTIYQWVQTYSADLLKSFNRKKRPVNKSWRLDETQIKIKGTWKYLYRAVDNKGDTVDFMLSSKRNQVAAANFLCRSINNNEVPDKINIDQSGANTAGIELYNQVTGAKIEIRQCKYLNNIIEGDHFGLKKSLTSSTGFKRFETAKNSIYGTELIRMIRKNQYDFNGSVRASQFEILKNIAMAA